MGQVKKKVKTGNFYFTIYHYIKSYNKLPKLDLSKQARNYYIKTLKKANLIKYVGYKTWEVVEDYQENKINRIINEQKQVKKKVKTLGTLNDFQSNLHALQIEIPILNGNLDLVKDLDGYAQESLKGWRPQYKRILNPIGFTIKNNNNKSISIYLFSRELPRNVDLTPLLIQTILYTNHILIQKGVKIDYFQARTKTLHFSVRNNDLDKVFNKGESFTVFLKRDCAKLFENDSLREAYAKVDRSPYLGIETNDIQYKENLIMMPERIERMQEMMMPLLQSLNLNQSLSSIQSQIHKIDDTFLLKDQINQLNREDKSKLSDWIFERFSI